MVKAYEEEKREGKQEEPLATNNDDLADKGALDADPVVGNTHIIEGNDDDVVVLKSGPVDSHMQELLQRSLERGSLLNLKKIEENIWDFSLKRTSYPSLLAEMNKCGQTLSQDQELLKFTEFMELQGSLNIYIRNLQQVNQSPLARAIAIALGIPINALPGEMLAAILYVINTTVCTIFADTNSTGFTMAGFARSQESCIINIFYFAYAVSLGLIVLANSRYIQARNEAQFFPQEYRNNITLVLRVLFLMLPLMDAAKTASLENGIVSNFLPSRTADAERKQTFTEFHQQISTYMEAPLLIAEENITLSQLLAAAKELQLSHNSAVSKEHGIYYQLSQRIKNFQKDREALEQNIARLDEKFKEDIKSIHSHYISLYGFNATIVADWRKYMNLNTDSNIEISEQDVIQFIAKIHGEYDEVNNLVIEFKTKQEEYQQELSRLKTEFDEIKDKLTKLKERKQEIGIEIDDENSVLLTKEQSRNTHYGTSSIAVSAQRSGGSPIYYGTINGAPDEYIIVNGNGSPSRSSSPSSGRSPSPHSL